MANLFFDTNDPFPRRRYKLQLLNAEGGKTETYLDAPSALNQFGSAGWELVSTGNLNDLNGTGACFLIFKRRKP